jgi:hypothetical protein
MGVELAVKIQALPHQLFKITTIIAAPIIILKEIYKRITTTIAVKVDLVLVSNYK